MTEKKFGSAGAKLVMEEFLKGEEVSFLVFSDGSRGLPMASVQDHKRAQDGDQGPNTGGMGTVSPTTNISIDGHKRIMQEIVLPTIAGLAAEGRRFQGVLFAGLMMTESGPKVLEYNARFGDPETQVIMARMRSDLLPILDQCAAGQLGETRIEWAKEPAVCVVLASKGYPETPETGKVISGLESFKDWSDVFVYHAATETRRRAGQDGRRPRARRDRARRQPGGGDRAGLRSRRQDPLRRHVLPPRHRPPRPGPPAPAAPGLSSGRGALPERRLLLAAAILGPAAEPRRHPLGAAVTLPPGREGRRRRVDGA